MSWWTRRGAKIEKHSTKMKAAITVNFAHAMGGVALSDLGLYRRDPARYPDEPDVLPAELARVALRRVER